MPAKFGVRRFTEYRDDRRCFELYEIRTGECASFPGTKRDLERYAKQRNAEARAAIAKAEGRYENGHLAQCAQRFVSAAECTCGKAEADEADEA